MNCRDRVGSGHRQTEVIYVARNVKNVRLRWAEQEQIQKNTENPISIGYAHKTRVNLLAAKFIGDGAKDTLDAWRTTFTPFDETYAEGH